MREIKGFPKYYAHEDGYIVSTKTYRGNNYRILNQGGDQHGYQQVKLWHDGKPKTFKTHILIARAFLGDPPPDCQVNHINGIKSDNRPSNLEYISASANVKHAYKLGLKKKMIGTDHPTYKYDKDYCLIASQLRGVGLSDRSIARVLRATTRNWIRQNLGSNYNG